jgi:tetratricopeptide (TPR) repeat protein
MSAVPSSALFDLIKSLTKSEKRYFKIFSSKHTIGGENTYVVLFDYIDRLEEYDEEQLMRHFSGEAFLNKFSITKKRLHENIMRALDSFHANSSVEAQLHKYLHYAEILYKKSLYDQARRTLSSAFKLAEKHEKLYVMAEIQLRLKKLWETTGYANVGLDMLTEMREQDKDIALHTDLYSKLWFIKSKLIIHLNQKGPARSEEDNACFTSILNQIDSIEMTNGVFDHHYLVNHIRAACYFGMSQFDKSLEFLQKNLQLFEENPERLKEEVHVYFSQLSNVIYIQNKLGRHKEVDALLRQLKELERLQVDGTHEDLMIKLFASINSTELSLLNGRGEFMRAVALEGIVLEGFRLYGTKLNPARRAFMSFQMAVAHFGCGDFSAALKWINLILNDKDLDQKEDLFCFAQLFALVVHFELNHKQLLPYAIKNTQRYLKSRNKVYEFERIFLKYLNKLTKVDSPLDELDLLEEVYKEIEPLKQNPYENVVFDAFNFLLWMQAKVKNVPFMDLVKRDYLDRSK